MDVMFLDKQVTLITPFSPERRTKLFHRGGWTFFKSTWVSVRCEKGGKGELYGHSMYHRFLCSLLARMQHVDATRCVSPTIHTHRQSTFTISAYTYSLFVFSDICLIIHPLAKEITTLKKTRFISRKVSQETRSQESFQNGEQRESTTSIHKGRRGKESVRLRALPATNWASSTGIALLSFTLVILARAFPGDKTRDHTIQT